MPSVNMHEAKTRLSALVDAVESGRESEIVIARNGRPAVRIVPLEPRRKVRLGLAKGQFRVPTEEEWARDDAIIQAMFEESSIWPDETKK